MGIYIFAKEWVPLVLYFGAILALILALTGRVTACLMYLLPLYPLQNVYEKLFVFPLGEKISTLLIVAMLVGWGTSKGGAKEPFFVPSPFNVLLILYMVFTYWSLWMGSQFLGPNVLASIADARLQVSIADTRLQVWKGYILLQVLFFIVVNNVRTKAQIMQILIITCATMVVMDYYNIRQVTEMGSWLSREKFNGTFNLGANEVAAFYVTYTFILLGLWILEPKEIKYRPLFLFLIISNFFLVLFLFSRGAYLAFLIAWCFISINRKPLWIIPVVITLLFWQSILPDEVINRITFSEVEGALDESAAKRLVLWEQSINYFINNPILGIGFNVFQHQGLHYDTHNIYLRTATEQGIIGIFFLEAIFILSFTRGWLLYRHTDDPFFKGLGIGFCTCVLSMMVVNIFGDRWTHIPLNAFFWVFLGMVERGHFLVSSTATTLNPVHSTHL